VGCWVRGLVGSRVVLPRAHRFFWLFSFMLQFLWCCYFGEKNIHPWSLLLNVKTFVLPHSNRNFWVRNAWDSDGFRSTGDSPDAHIGCSCFKIVSLCKSVLTVWRWIDAFALMQPENRFCLCDVTQGWDIWRTEPKRAANYELLLLAFSVEIWASET
jgi:hypothetical protein